ncbi:STAS domain-containing protein [Aneurinibacillus migulanus]|uniref:RsbT co-antagonist protein RsbR n=1 Tax=Aneurinibacillus migulanus TaxID=47500 RepID=A0A0K2WFZ6_ANEMI|nr:STAS domain-containing protein [Aneurinibacillus migulanus]MCP1357030.1 STAS domain-containing protein [Aneurinibacillus migulanus]MED0892400.1 STAS domain-containing protein [Aneurinibacillus migulanus]MED1615647.1 STAS domain-containing protein [Aneurinibacillus migulanus]MED4731171.1 STAS domain-containing protein [Aneurinibacillus migulanus]CEH30452.1 Putative RsbT co-antagonist protein rsbRD [Aneurinibacillus migulanus]
METIQNIADYLLEQNEHIAAEIFAKATEEVETLYTQDEFTKRTAFIADFILFFGHYLRDGEQAASYHNLIEKSRLLGKIEAQTGKRISDCMPLYSIIRTLFTESILSDDRFSLTKEEILAFGAKFHAFFDVFLRETVQAFNDFKDILLKTVREELNELSAPIVPIDKGIAILPLIGAIDSHRARYILEKGILRVVDLKIQYLIIDFSGLQTIDTLVADYLFKIENVLRLLGIEAVVTGIRPAIAKTAIDIGIDLSSIKAYGTVQQALEGINH